MDFFEIKLERIVKETSDSYSFIFGVPEGYTFKAGQHAAWKFKDHKVEEGDRPNRVFSIASAPEDGFLMFTTRISTPHTSFKEILLNQLKVGDSMYIADARGEFDFHKEYAKTLVIAGGIGITPIRSILKAWSVNNDPNHAIEVLYSDDRGEFAYRESLEQISAVMPNLTLRRVSQREEFMNGVDLYANENQNNAEYLIAGSPGMNKAFKERLMNLGIEEANIKLDNFIGYE